MSEAGVLGPGSWLLASQSQGFSSRDLVDVALFPAGDRLPQCAVWAALPQGSFEEAETAASLALGLPPGPCSLRLSRCAPEATALKGKLLEHGTWSGCTSQGAWLHVSSEADDHQPICNSRGRELEDSDWPPVRCAPQLLSGRLSRSDFESALTAAQRGSPALAASAHLLP
ncbi:unnamed protein product, partial [Polarella glacialis]